MPKKIKDWEFPPDIFWITPDGETMDIVGHLSAIQQDPGAYGFHFPPQTAEEINHVFTTLLRDNWVRGRFSSGEAYFQIWTINKPVLDSIVEFVSKFYGQIKLVAVEQVYPNRIYESTPKAFLSDRVIPNPKKK